ncbi:MAG: hypothetical protein GY701_30440, partial [Sulfitobacter sp.]|nr:hypothetical protein [Sulfitobacter sp.]
AELFGNLGDGLSTNVAVTATGNWWGAADGPGGVGPGSGDSVTANVDYADFLTEGSAFSYLNAGPNTSEGTLDAPAITQGTGSSAFGSGWGQQVLYDLDRVILDYGSVPSDQRFDLILTYLNADQTASIGGDIQRLESVGGLVVHGSLVMPDGTAEQRRYPLPESAHGDDSLALDFIRENGQRAVVSEVWLVERLPGAGDTDDTTAPVSALSSPAADSHLGGSLVEVTGNTTDEDGGSGLSRVELGIDDGSGIQWIAVTELESDSGDWRYRWDLPADGPYTLYARGVDQEGNREAPVAGVAVEVNQTAPAAPTGLSVGDTPSDSGGSIGLSWNLSADDGAGADDIDSYDLQRRQPGDADFVSVGTVPAGSGSGTDATAVTGTDYEYRVVAVDLAGNRGTSAVYGPVIAIDNSADSTPPEEVTGLTATPGDGTVYLHWTPSADSARDLTGQRLDVSRDEGTTWGSNGPDFDDGNSIALSKEAVSRLVSGLSNGSGYRFRIRTRDGAGNVSDGTQTGTVIPSGTAVTTVSGTLNSDTTWGAGVYYVSDYLTISSGATLTILPGVVVKFAAQRYLNISAGALYAVGTVSKPIVFTAYTDDSVGGDSNGDGSATSPVRGYWDRILFSDGTLDGVTRLEHVQVRYGGSSNNGNVHVNRANIAILNSEIRDSSHVGIYSYNASPRIEGNRIADNNSIGIHMPYHGAAQILDNTVENNAGHGIYSRYGTPAVNDNMIIGNSGHGIYHNASAAAPRIIGNTITGNAQTARLPFSALPGLGDGNTLSGNTRDQIDFWGGTLNGNLSLSVDQLYYQISGTTTVPTGALLELAPGLIWKFGSNARLTVNGALRAVGTAGERIVFTSYRDDTVGGDSNSDGASAGEPGDWSSINFNDAVLDYLTELNHVDVRYGGNGNTYNIYVYKANFPIRNSEITHSAYYGLYLQDNTMVLEDNRIADNASEAGIYFYRGS